MTTIGNAKRHVAVMGTQDVPSLSPAGQVYDFTGKAMLTPRECEVLALIAGGASNKETGRCLGISPRTVETHRAHIMGKTGARNAADLVRIALASTRPSAGNAPHLVA